MKEKGGYTITSTTGGFLLLQGDKPEINRLMKNYKIERLVDKAPILCNKLKQFCYDINGCCQEVHRDMGPFLNEYMYQDALEIVL